MLTVTDNIPQKTLDLPAHRLHEVLTGPTLIHLDGQKKPALFLSVLLHGNETTSWEVTKNILKAYQDKSLPRSLSIFIGNIKAARYKKRKLDKEPDFNRIWDDGETPYHKMMQTVIDDMQQRDLFASIDIHNNTGLNPHYACINRLDPRFLTLARRFSRTVIYFIRPRGVQSLALSKYCPAVTLECGQSGDEYGINIATKFVEEILNLDDIPNTQDIHLDTDLYHTVAVVKMAEQYSLSFDGGAADVEFIKGIERLNFEEIAPDTSLANIKESVRQPLIVLDEQGNDVFTDYFQIKNNTLTNRKVFTPAMLTTDENIIRQDCLCYLMEHYDIAQGEKSVEDEHRLWV